MPSASGSTKWTAPFARIERLVERIARGAGRDEAGDGRIAEDLRVRAGVRLHVEHAARVHRAQLGPRDERRGRRSAPAVRPVVVYGRPGGGGVGDAGGNRKQDRAQVHLPQKRRRHRPRAGPGVVEGQRHPFRTRVHAVDHQPRDLVACHRAIAVVDEVLQARLEPRARHVVEVKDGQGADRSAEEERGIAAGREIEQSPHGAAAFCERHSRHRRSPPIILLCARVCVGVS